MFITVSLIIYILTYFFNKFVSVDTEDMSVNFGTFKLGIPPNFKEVLEALTREILKEQPTDIATFSAIFLNELLEKREREYNVF